MLAALCAAAAVTTLAQSSYIPQLRSIQLDLGASESAVAATVSGYGLALAVGQLVWGWILHRVEPVKAFQAGLFIFVATGLAAALLPLSVAGVIGARAGQGLGAAALTLSGTVFLSSRMQGAGRDRAIALLVSCASLGAVVGPALGAWLAALGSSWQITSFPAVVLASVAAVGVVLSRPSFQRSVTSASGHQTGSPTPTPGLSALDSLTGGNHGQPRYRAEFAAVLGVAVVVGIAIYASHTALAFSIGTAAGERTLLFSCLPVGVFVGSVAARFLLARGKDNLALLLSSLVLVAAATGLAGVASSEDGDQVWMATLLTLAGAAFGICFPSLPLLVRELSATRFALLLGVVEFGRNLGATAGPLLVGAVVSRPEAQAADGYLVMAAAAALAVVLSGVLLVASARRRRGALLSMSMTVGD